jgi:hypothetical protein
VSLPLAGLFDGAADVWLVADAPGGGLAETLLRNVTEPDISVDLARNGGFAAIVARAGTPLFRAAVRPTYALPRAEPAVSVLGADGTAALGTDPSATLRLAPGWSAVPGRSPGQWTVQAPEQVTPGEMTIVTVEAAGAQDGVPAVAHARIVVPLSPGSHPLSAMPFLSCRNEVGPVERDLANGGGDPRDGGQLTVGGVTYAEGLGVSQKSNVEFALAGSPRVLTGAVAVDDETPGATAIASIVVDGVRRKTWELHGGEPPVAFELSIEDAARLELRTDPGPGQSEAHIDWIQPRLVA